MARNGRSARRTRTTRPSRLYDAAPLEAAHCARSAIATADSALDRDRRDARALEVRGTARYWLSILDITPDPVEHRALLDAARSDLELAVREDPHLASAYSTLSHLYYRDNVAQAVLAARKAYEEDAYLDVADEVLWRLFNGELDLGVFPQAQRWCHEGARRFPDDYRFDYCQLQLMTTPAVSPDPARAWELAQRVTAEAPARNRDYWRLRSLMNVGGVLARAPTVQGPRSARSWQTAPRRSSTAPARRSR